MMSIRMTSESAETFCRSLECCASDVGLHHARLEGGVEFDGSFDGCAPADRADHALPGGVVRDLPGTTLQSCGVACDAAAVDGCCGHGLG